MSAPLLGMRGIYKSFPGVQALADASLSVHAGEVHGLAGENGAGKTTLMKILSGQVQPDAGAIVLGGEPWRAITPQAAAASGVAMVQQELPLVDGLSVAANIWLGAEASRAGWLRHAHAVREAQHLLRRLDADIDASALVGTLSVGARQRVVIARALRARARLLIMDEATAALSQHEATALFATVRRLASQGVGIIYISHRLEEVLALCDAVTVMRDGRTVATRPRHTLSAAALITLMVGREPNLVPAKRGTALGPQLLQVHDLAQEGVFGPLSFAVRAGEIFGLAGLIGSGRTALARAMFGAARVDAGHTVVDGHILRNHRPRDAIAAGLGYLPEDRQRQGLVLKRIVSENIGLACLDTLAPRGVVVRQRERSWMRGVARRLRLRTATLDTLAAHLSGGNQQKVVLAKWLAASCRVLILNAPTRGVDLAAKAEIYALLTELAARGMAIVLISSELAELAALCDRVGVMYRGQMLDIVPAHAASQERLLHLALGAPGAGAESGAPV